MDFLITEDECDFDVVAAEALALRALQSIRQHKEGSRRGEALSENVSSILTTCNELEALVAPPKLWTFRAANAHQRSTAICLLLEWDIPRLLSNAGGSMSIEGLSDTCKVSRPLLKCILRECIFQHVLDEPSPGTYQLNRHSRALLQDALEAKIHYLSDVGLRAGAHLPEYVSKVEEGHLVNHSSQTAFQMAFRTENTLYQFHEEVDKVSGARFDKYMKTKATRAPIESFFEFDNLEPGSLVVDVGGGNGHDSIRTAHQHPHLSFIVQDYDGKRPQDYDKIDAAVLRRITWQKHDFFTEQPVKGADIYMMSNVFMDETQT